MIRIDQYLKEILKLYKTGDTLEHSYRTVFESLIKSVIEKQIGKKFQFIQEPKRDKFGAPDFKLTDTSGAVVGYIECKDLGAHLDDLIESEQIKKYLAVSDNFIFTNYLDFILFKNGEPVMRSVISSLPELKSHNLRPRDIEGLEKLLESFILSTPVKIKSTKKLAEALAKRTRTLKDIIYDELQNIENNPFIKFYNEFEKHIYHDLTQEQFADIYAQIIGFGLLFLRLSWDEDEVMTRKNITHNIPEYIPLLADFFTWAKFQRWGKTAVWIVDEILNLLNFLDTHFIKESLSYKGLSVTQKRDIKQQDPFIYFYEEFLKVYNPVMRMERGVFYTPEAVVSFIIRSLDIILKTRLKVSKGFLDDSIKVLDFASGTGTFILALIEYIKNTLFETGNKGLWDLEVHEFLLKNVYGFELLAVPYIISHFRIHEFLEDFNIKYDERTDRLEVYLTNTLDNTFDQGSMFLEGFAYEGEQAARVKNEEDILVVMGNPPYSVSSQNQSEFINRIMNTYKTAVKGERNIQPLSDDYIKFIRFAQWKMEQVEKGTAGMITNNSFMEGLIHRGMREELMKTFDEIYILNLHGNSNKGETAPDGGKDENVFDIRVGVSISLLVKTGRKKNENAGVYYAELSGLRESKYEALYDNNINTLTWEKLPAESPDFWFVPKNMKGMKNYQTGWSIPEIFKEYNSGIQTQKDGITIQFKQEKLVDVKKDILNLDEKEFCNKYQITTNKDWNISKSKKDLETKPPLVDVQYRPFDIRKSFYSGKTGGFMVRPRRDIMRHFIAGENIGLCFTRQLSSQFYQHALITNTITERCYVSLRTREVGYVAPLYLYPAEGDLSRERMVNFTPEFQRDVAENLYGSQFSPEEILAYIYAVLYSPVYREKYNEFLKIDFPRVPFTGDVNQFRALSEQGQRLIELHLLRSVPASKVTYHNSSDNLKVTGIRRKEERVYFNDGAYFEGVSEAVWNYEIGGYTVLQKWLKERKKHGVVLELADIHHFIDVCAVLEETIIIQEKIRDMTVWV